MRATHIYCRILAVVFLSALAATATAGDVIEEWAAVQAPKAPELKPVTLDAGSTALLLLDFIKQSCNNERRPRCVASVPKMEKLLQQARAAKVMVVYSVTSSSTPADIVKELAPAGGEPVVKAMADKFLGTDLEKILKDKGIKTVIVTGTAAHGAVLNTGSQAAFRGFKVIVPVDGMSSENTYFEQYTAYHMTGAPGVAQQVTLTRSDMIK